MSHVGEGEGGRGKGEGDILMPVLNLLKVDNVHISFASSNNIFQSRHKQRLTTP